MRKDIIRNLLLSIISMGVIYVTYWMFGVNDLFIWRHGIQNIFIAITCTFLVQTITKKSMLHPAWYPGLITFYLWLGAFSYIRSHAGGGFALSL